MDYYGNNDFLDYLALKHYGVKGMKWHQHKKRRFYNSEEPVKNALRDAVIKITGKALSKKLSTKKVNKGRNAAKKALANATLKITGAVLKKKLSQNQGIKRGERVSGARSKKASGEPIYSDKRPNTSNGRIQRKKHYTTGTGLKRGEKRTKKLKGPRRKVFYDE